MKKMTVILLALIVATVITLLACGQKSEEEIQMETETTETVEATTKETEDVSVEPVTDSSSDSTDSVPETTAERVETEPETTLSAEELAQICLNEGINGPDREAFLGERYGEVQEWLEENYVPPYVPEPEGVGDYFPTYGGDVLTPDAGINYYYGVLETYYNLDMSWNIDVMRGMGFDAENYPYWVRGDGCKMLGDYVMVAADFGWEPRGTITETSLGPAIVVDTGAGGWYWHDICVTW